MINNYICYTCFFTFFCVYAEYGDISNFSNPGQMLAFAGIEPGIDESGTESHGGRMVKHGSSKLRYVLLNACLPLIRFDLTFATYYAKKLIRVIYALERQDIDFNAQKLR
ncbi:MAG: IS110 family transposase [Blautia wexlerae]